MKAATIISSMPMQGLKEGKQPQMIQELQGNSFMDLIQQQMGTFSNGNGEEQEKIEIVELLDLLEGALGPLNSLLAPIAHVELNEDIKLVQTNLNDLFAKIQQGSTPAMLDQQQLASLLEKAKLILQQATNVKNQGDLTFDDHQRWNEVINTAFKQMGQLEKDLQGIGRNKQNKDVLISKTNQPVPPIPGFAVPVQRFSNPLPSKWMARVQLNHGELEHSVLIDKVSRNSVPKDTVLFQAIDTDEGDILNLDSHSFNQQPIIQVNTTSSIPAIQGNKVPIHQLMNYLEPQLLTTSNPKVGETIQKMILQLQPESLGKLDVHIQSQNGQITAQFMVENATAKYAVEEQMTQLRQNLQAQGVSVHSLEVIETAATNHQLFQQQHKQPHEQRTPYFSRGKKAKEYLELEDELISHREFHQPSSNTSVNYIV